MHVGCDCKGCQQLRRFAVGEFVERQPRRGAKAQPKPATDSVLRESIAERMTLAPSASDGPYDCPLCVRTKLRADCDFWNHMRDKHRPADLVGATFDDNLESVLIQIVNSASHEDAVRIATAALLGVMEVSRERR